MGFVSAYRDRVKAHVYGHHRGGDNLCLYL
jgi:hypothetical protein